MKRMTLKQCKEDKLLILIDNEAQLSHIAKFIDGIHLNKNKYYPGLLRIFHMDSSVIFSTPSDVSFSYIFGMNPDKAILKIYAGKFNYVKYSQLQLLTKEDKNNLLQLIKSI